MRRTPTATRPALVELEGRYTPTFYGNQLFPADNPWNQPITNAPVAANSASIIGRIAARTGTRGLHPDFGNPATDGALYGIPVNVVDGTTPKVTVTIPSFGYGGESDNIPVPIPVTAVIEGDGPTGPAAPSSRGDSHLLVYDKTANVLYELYQAIRPTETSYPYGGTKPVGNWGAYQISVWDMKANSFRTPGWTSADAAGLPILPGLVRPDEALPAVAGGQGAINHAIRVTVQQTRNAYVYPGSHVASSRTGTDLPRMGERFRLKSSFVIPSNWAPEAKAVAQAMKDYGLIVADNGSDFFFQGTPSNQWNMSSMLAVGAIKSSDFEVVDLTPIVTGLSVATGGTAGGTAVSITGRNFSGAAGNLHVLFGTTEATAFTIVSDTRIDVTAPAHAAGAVDVRVQSGSVRPDADGVSVFFGYGTSAVTAADRFTYTTATSPPPAGGFGDDFSGAAPNSAWRFVNGTWSQANGVLRQANTAPTDPEKALVADRTWLAAQEVVASVRVDSWQDGDFARAGVGVRTDAAGLGYNLVFHGRDRVQFLNDHVAWGNSFALPWQVGTWYRFKLRSDVDGVLRGKVWAAGQAEPAAWQFTQAGWADRAGGTPALNGGSSGEGFSTASFDDVAAADVTAPPPGTLPFGDDFAAPAPGAGWSFTVGAWAQAGGVLSQAGSAAGDPKKAVLTGLPVGAAAEVEASVRVDSWQDGDFARAGVGLGTDAAGLGYNLVFHGRGRVQFLNDHVAWGNSFAFDWQVGTWYRFKLRQEADGTLRGKVWAAGQAEPAGWTFAQAGWAYRSGWAALNGGSAASGQGGSTASFDDLAVRA